MKKRLLTACCALAITNNSSAMLNKLADNDNFHGCLLNTQIQKMICHDRADELKLWLDQASKRNSLPISLVATLHAFAGQQNAQKSADVLLAFMMQTGL
jgi:hypothetical protein